MRAQIRAGLIALSLLAAGTAASVPTAAMAATSPIMQEVPLSGDLIDNFIHTYATMRDAAIAIGKKYHINLKGKTAEDRWSQFSTASAAWGELDSAARANGFDSGLQWLQVTITIARSYAFAKGGAAISAGMAVAAEQIKNSSALTDAQKEMMLKQMASAAGSVQEAKPSQANIDAVTPYEGKLKAVLK